MLLACCSKLDSSQKSTVTAHRMPLIHTKVSTRRQNGKVRGRSNRYLDQLTFLSSFSDAGQFIHTDILYKIMNATGKRDTVNSVGSWTTKTLPFTAYNPMVRTFRHAVSLDERRAKFRPNLWNPSPKTPTPSESGGPGKGPSLSDIKKLETIKSMVDEKSKGLEPTHVDEVNCSLPVALYFH